MIEIVKYVLANWWNGDFLAISAFLDNSYRQLTKRQKEEAQKSAALHDGMQALLRDRIYQV